MVRYERVKRLALRVVVFRLRGAAAGLWFWRRTRGRSLGCYHGGFGFVSGCFPLVVGLVSTSLWTVIMVVGVLKVLVPVGWDGWNSLGG